MQWTEHLSLHIKTEIKLMFSHLSSLFLRERISPWNVGSQRQSVPISLHLVTVTTITITWFTDGDLVNLSLSYDYGRLFWWFSFLIVIFAFWKEIYLVQETIIHANSFQYENIINQHQHTLSVSDMILRSGVSLCKEEYFVSSQQYKHLPRNSEKIV